FFSRWNDYPQSIPQVLEPPQALKSKGFYQDAAGSTVCCSSCPRLNPVRPAYPFHNWKNK
ncbi:hypothetical protein, partial [Rhodoferax sp.]|uniref:hypothetical protein n=1 Tax=Rhodoferax sp. TaxID=50421 RepID=UPI0025E79F4F